MPVTYSKDPSINEAVGALLRLFPTSEPKHLGGRYEPHQERDAIARQKFHLMLGIAVPVWLEELAGTDPEVLKRRAQVASDLIGEGGAKLIFPHPSKGKEPRNLIDMRLNGEGRNKLGDWSPHPLPTVAELFNALAEGIAAGVLLSGQSFEEWAQWLGLMGPREK